jgi:multidrug efflux pump subunit AcrB
VTRADVPQWTRVTADGHDAVIFQIYQQPGSNTVAIANEVKAKLAAFRASLPSGIAIANWYDQSELIVSSAKSVRDAVLIGIVLAVLILLIFLRNWKVTLIAAITVPSVLVASALLLSVLNMSFNVMTLGGMAAAVGLIIDDAIVMIEHILRRMHGHTGDPARRVMDAAREFTPPLIGSSASTVIIFVPLAFLSGVTGAFFGALSVTMAVGLILSFFISWLVIPLLAVRFLSENDSPQEGHGALGRRIHAGYETILKRGLARPWLLLLLVPLLLLGWLGYRQVGSGFMPSVDEGGFILDFKAGPGTSLTETDRLVRQVEAILRDTPEVQTYSRRAGLQLGGGLTEANEGDFFVRLRPLPRRPIDAVMDDVRARVERTVPGVEIEMAQLMEDLIGDLTAVPQPVEIKIYSDDHQTLMTAAPRVAEAIGKIPGVVDVKNGIVFAGDALEIHVDRVKAALEKVDAESVTGLLGDALSGVVTTQVQSGPKMIGVRVWIPPEARSTTEKIGELKLRAPDGHVFPLKRIATTNALSGEPQITRDNLKEMVAVTARISGRDMGSVIADVRSVLDRSRLLPSNSYYALGGLYAEQRAAFAGLMTVFVAAVLLVFLLLLFYYESFRVALAILATTLLAVPAVFIGLWLTRTELNISSMMGLTMIVGIVTEVGIFYCSELFSLPAGDQAANLIDAGKNRMRPITMTTLAAILALMPLALGLGQGSAMQQPLAVAIISGLVVQLPLVLIALPLLLVLLGVRRVVNPPTPEAS